MKRTFRILLTCFTVGLLLVSLLQAATFNLTPYTDLDYNYTSPDTLRNSGSSDVAKLLRATTLTIAFHNYQPLDSAYVIVEASNDTLDWFMLSDSVLVQDDEDYTFIIPYAEAFTYYRGRINTDVGGADTTRTVIKFLAGGKTNVK